MLPPPSLVSAALAALSLPPARAVHLIRAGLVRTWEIEIEGAPPVWIRIPAASAGAPALWMERAVLGHLRRTALGAQIADPYTVLDAGGVPLAVLPRPAGRPATAAFGTDGRAIGRALGAWLARMPAAMETHATAADGPEFLRDQPTWPEAIEAELARVRVGLARAGWGLGAIEQRLADRVTAGLSGLRGVDRFGPVHRELAPDRVWVDGDRITAIVDWDGAWIADPWMQWSGLVLQPPAVLAPMVEGAGIAMADGLDRLEVYAAFGVLTRYEARVRGAWNSEAASAAACLAVEEAGVVDGGLRGRLAPVAGDGLWPGWSPDAVALLLRGVLHRLATDGDRLDGRLELALACGLLADGAADDASMWLQRGRALLASLPASGDPAVGPSHDPLPRALAVDGPFAAAALTAWLASRAVARVGDVDPAVRAAIVQRVERRRVADERPQLAPGEVLVQNALIGAAASAGTPRADAWRRSLADEWSSADLTSRDEGASEGASPVDVGLAPVLLALRCLPPDALPAPADEILRGIAPHT